MYENYDIYSPHTVNLKGSLNELLQDFNKVTLWKMKEQRNIFVEVVQKNMDLVCASVIEEEQVGVGETTTWCI